MTLQLVEAEELSQEDINRGVNAAQSYFDERMIIPELVYRHVLAEAIGDNHVTGFLQMWETVDRIALDAAFQGRKPESVPMLIHKR